MKVAKGIDGIRNFLANKAKEQTSGWHIFRNPTDPTTEFSTETAETIIKDMNNQGLTFTGWSGNGLFFDKI